MARKIATQSADQAEAAASQASESVNAQPGSLNPSAVEPSLPVGAAGETKIETTGTDGISVTDLAAPVEGAPTGHPTAGIAVAGGEDPLFNDGPEASDALTGEPADVDAADLGGIGPDNVQVEAKTDANAKSLSNPNPLVVQVYPRRSYMDAGELRRRGGSAYMAPRRHAEDLVQRKLASFEPLEE